MTMRALTAAVLMAAAIPTAAGAAGACASAAPFKQGFRVLDAFRIVTGADGESAFVDAPIPLEGKAYFKPGELFGAIDFKAAKRVQLVAGPPNADLPFHPSVGYELFLTVQGSSTIMLANGQTRIAGAGTLVIMEDMKSKKGHGGRTGPCGYVALQIVPVAVLP